uniref:Lipase_3 domain-containing protein n=1 Tax=Rhabditophanes sp. KR3021 TaxID=114890 RepID=A0AC35THG2_9BILA
MICLLQLILVAAAISTANAGMVNACSDVKDCAKCADSHINIFAFKEHCRWCIDTKSCTGPLVCPASSAYASKDAFKCPTVAPLAKGKRYTTKLGRSLYSLVLASKHDKPEKCIKNSRPDVKISKFANVECDSSKNKCGGLTAVSKEAKALYLIFRGANTLDKQMFTEFIHSIASQFGAWQNFSYGTGVMSYFYTAFQRLFVEELMTDIKSLIKQYPDYRLWITGHGIGGSLASMTALYMTNKTMIPSEKIRLVTFGEPRGSNYLFAKSIEKHIQFRYRVVNRKDLVANTPAILDPEGNMLTNAANEKQPYHYRYAVHYDDNDQDFDICENSEDHKCRNLLGGDIADHFTYFGVKIEDYLKSGCKKDIFV